MRKSSLKITNNKPINNETPFQIEDMSRRSSALAYYYISTREEGYEQLTKKNSLEICKKMGFKFSNLGVANDYYTIQQRTNRTQNSGSTKSNNSLLKDFRLCIDYLDKNGFANANSIAKTELELLISNIKSTI